MRCHFVPQSYLRRFTNDRNLLECFDLNRKYGPTKSKATKVTAQIEDWYMLTGIDDLPNLSCRIGERQIEEEYQRLFEKDLTSSLDHLESGGLTPKNKETIARFMAYQLHRVPRSREYYRQIQEWDPNEPMTTEEQMRRIGEITLGHIETSFSAVALAPYLMESQWVLVQGVEDRPFVTSDNPIGCHQHSSNMNHVPLLEQAGVSGEELRTRQSAYVVSVSPRYVLYVNTSFPADAKDVRLISGKWDDARVREYNDLVFRSCLSCVYTVTREAAEEFGRRFAAGEIAQDLFTDDPWKDESVMKDLA